MKSSRAAIPAASWFVSVQPHLVSEVDSQVVKTEGNLVPGNSGGALFTKDWRIVGLVSSVGALLGESTRIDLVINRLKAWNYPVQLELGEPLDRPPSDAPQPKCQISGVVFDSTQNEPLSAVQLSLRTGPTPEARRGKTVAKRVATTGPDGSFQLECPVELDGALFPLTVELWHPNWKAQVVTREQVAALEKRVGVNIPVRIRREMLKQPPYESKAAIRPGTIGEILTIQTRGSARSYDFTSKKLGTGPTGGDFYFSGEYPSFFANNSGQMGLRDFGETGSTLNQLPRCSTILRSTASTRLSATSTWRKPELPAQSLSSEFSTLGIPTARPTTTRSNTSTEPAESGRSRGDRPRLPLVVEQNSRNNRVPCRIAAVPALPQSGLYSPAPSVLWWDQPEVPMSKNSISRRHFIGGAVASTVAANAANPRVETGLPTRILGGTGERVSMLALGCGSRLLIYKEEDKGVEVLDMALKAGITYLDTAQGYGNGKSESWVGEAIKGRRKGLFLATKTQARTADDVLRRAEESLKRLGVDQMDLLHIHSLGGPEDLAVIEKEGVMEALYKVKERGLARYIGITSHSDPETLAEALTRYDVDCTQMALNAALQGMKSGPGKMVINPVMSTSFENVALPVAKKKNLGIIAMKAFGQDDIIGEDATPEKLLRYALSLPASIVTMGVPKHEHLLENVATARNFTPMPPDEMKEFSHRTAARYKMALDRKFAAHMDA